MDESQDLLKQYVDKSLELKLKKKLWKTPSRHSRRNYKRNFCCNPWRNFWENYRRNSSRNFQNFWRISWRNICRNFLGIPKEMADGIPPEILVGIAAEVTNTNPSSDCYRELFFLKHFKLGFRDESAYRRKPLIEKLGYLTDFVWNKI